MPTVTPAHLQGILLQQLQALLAAYCPAVGGRVYVDHPDELTAAMLPAIVLRAGDEQVQTDGMGIAAALQTRSWLVDVTAVCAGSQSAAEARNLGATVESVLLGAYAVSALAGNGLHNIELTALRPQVNGSTSELVAELTLSFQLTYATTAGTPGSPA